jgi:hypothetical protein
MREEASEWKTYENETVQGGWGRRTETGKGPQEFCLCLRA